MTDAPEPTPKTTRPSRFFSEGRAGFVALGVSALALIVAALPYANGGDFDGRVRAYLLKNPQILQEVSARLEEESFVQQQVQQTAQAEESTRRLAVNPSLLAPDARDPAVGPVNAKVTVVEFFDYRCPGCKATAPDLLRLIDAHPDVRFVFKEWPILPSADGASVYAAQAALAAHQQGKYIPVFRDLMATSFLDRAAIERVLAANDIVMPAALKTMASTETVRHLTDIKTTAAALGVAGTPTFFINGRASPSIQPADIDKAIRAAKAG